MFINRDQSNSTSLGNAPIAGTSGLDKQVGRKKPHFLTLVREREREREGGRETMGYLSSLSEAFGLFIVSCNDNVNTTQ